MNEVLQLALWPLSFILILHVSGSPPVAADATVTTVYGPCPQQAHRLAGVMDK